MTTAHGHAVVPAVMLSHATMLQAVLAKAPREAISMLVLWPLPSMPVGVWAKCRAHKISHLARLRNCGWGLPG